MSLTMNSGMVGVNTVGCQYTIGSSSSKCGGLLYDPLASDTAVPFSTPYTNISAQANYGYNVTGIATNDTVMITGY